MCGDVDKYRCIAVERARLGECAFELFAAGKQMMHSELCMWADACWIHYTSCEEKVAVL